MNDHARGSHLFQTPQDVCRIQSKNFNFLIVYDYDHMESIYRHSDIVPTGKHECHLDGQLTLHIKAEGKVSVAKHRFLGAKEKFHAFDFELTDYKQARDGSTSATTLRDYW
jgi:hypothetical protein